MRSRTLGQVVGLGLAVLALVPTGAMAGTHHYYSGTIGSGYAVSSSSANLNISYTDGQANHNAFCAGVAQGYGGAVYGGAVAYTGCATSGGYASRGFSPGLNPGGPPPALGALHGAIKTDPGYGFSWTFTTATHYSWY